jgi:hypothetical protein
MALGPWMLRLHARRAGTMGRNCARTSGRANPHSGPARPSSYPNHDPLGASDRLNRNLPTIAGRPPPDDGRRVAGELRNRGEAPCEREGEGQGYRSSSPAERAAPCRVSRYPRDSSPWRVKEHLIPARPPRPWLADFDRRLAETRALAAQLPGLPAGVAEHRVVAAGRQWEVLRPGHSLTSGARSRRIRVKLVGGIVAHARAG